MDLIQLQGGSERGRWDSGLSETWMPPPSDPTLRESAPPPALSAPPRGQQPQRFVQASSTLVYSSENGTSQPVVRYPPELITDAIAIEAATSRLNPHDNTVERSFVRGQGAEYLEQNTQSYEHQNGQHVIQSDASVLMYNGENGTSGPVVWYPPEMIAGAISSQATAPRMSGGSTKIMQGNFDASGQPMGQNVTNDQYMVWCVHS